MTILSAFSLKNLARLPAGPWDQAWGEQEEALAMDDKTMKNALDEAGDQTHM